MTTCTGIAASRHNPITTHTSVHNYLSADHPPRTTDDAVLLPPLYTRILGSRRRRESERQTQVVVQSRYQRDTFRIWVRFLSEPARLTYADMSDDCSLTCANGDNVYCV